MGLLTYACALFAMQLIQLPGEKAFCNPLIYVFRVTLILLTRLLNHLWVICFKMICDKVNSNVIHSIFLYLKIVAFEITILKWLRLAIINN